MSFQGFEGPAGTGKTYRLIESVIEVCRQNRLKEHQKILALTFMHGSRRRLDDRLRRVSVLRGRFAAQTIDSFAASLCRRWRVLAAHHGIAFGESFGQTCDACGHLLEFRQVALWVARTFPIVVVDEAQELSASRLRIVRALEAHVRLFVAADEFQCLDETLDPESFVQWFNGGNITKLHHVHRTRMTGLLDAGVALRRLSSPISGPGLVIRYHYPNLMPFMIGSALCKFGTKAVLYAPGGARWASKVTSRLANGLRSKKFKIPPLRLSRESGANDETDHVMERFGNKELFDITEIVEQSAYTHDAPKWFPDVGVAAKRKLGTTAKQTWTVNELRELVGRTASNHRAYASQRRVGIRVMSIHQAKNREFDRVVLLWPPGVPGSDEYKARLLYNGITRAQKYCHVFVQTEQLLEQPPLKFRPLQDIATAL